MSDAETEVAEITVDGMQVAMEELSQAIVDALERRRDVLECLVDDSTGLEFFHTNELIHRTAAALSAIGSAAQCQGAIDNFQQIQETNRAIREAEEAE